MQQVAFLLIKTDLDDRITPVRIFTEVRERNFVQAILDSDPTTQLSIVELPLGQALALIP